MTLFQLRKTIEAQTNKALPAAQIADALGVTRQQYSLYETGKYMPSLSTARKMLHYFQQWMPELTLEGMVDILEETKNKRAAA